MTKRWTVVAVVATLAAGLACGGMGGSYENQKACKAWIAKQNGLRCMKDIQQDADKICPASLDMTPLDMTDYYGCMEKNAKCNGKVPDLKGQSSCSMPTP